MKNRGILGLLIAAGLLAAWIQRDRSSDPALAVDDETPIEVDGRTLVVVDGDTLRMGTTSIRLNAVDAPERNQHCGKDAARWPCGTAASTKLAELVGAGKVVCRKRNLDQYGRTVAVCRNGNTDLGAALVTAGLALAYRQYGDDYVDEEDEARAARRGMWADEFTPPWEWRRSEGRDAPAADAPDRPRSDPPTPAPPGQCSIKGNINSKGDRIYHVPGSPSYDATIIDLRNGERWFCSAREAENAGWRAPLR